jgi:UDP-glucose 4-epimerase
MSIFQKQKENKIPLTIVEPGYQTRDFIHVYDVVNANVIAATKDIKNYGEVYNIGTGIATKVQDIADLISKYQTRISERNGEVLHSRANIDKVRKELGWNYSINVLDWIKKNL